MYTFQLEIVSAEKSIFSGTVDSLVAMGELGEFAEEEHRVIGQYAQKMGIEQLFTVGNLSQLTTNEYNADSKEIGAEHFLDKAALQLALTRYLSDKHSKAVILIKGSRSAKMEDIVNFIKDNFSQ